MEFFQINIFILLEKCVKYIKSFKIQGTGYYDINVTFTRSPKDGLLEFIKFEFRYVYSFSCICKKDSKVFGKNIVTFCLHGQFVCFSLHMIIMTSS